MKMFAGVTLFCCLAGNIILLPFTGAQDLIINPPMRSTSPSPIDVIVGTTPVGPGVGDGERCGRVMSKPEDRIIHRPRDGDGERCSWILNVPHATDYEVTLESIGNQFAENITVLAFSDEKKGNPTQKILRVKKDYLFHGRTLVITYAINSSDVSPNGFKLSYTARLAEDDDSSSDSQVNAQVFPGAPTEIFADLETIIVQSPLSRSPSTEFYSLTFNGTELINGWRCGSDSVTIWAFKWGAWYRHAKLCGGQEHPPIVTYINRDIFMISYTRENPSASIRGIISYRFGDKLTESSKKVSRKTLIP